MFNKIITLFKFLKNFYNCQDFLIKKNFFFKGLIKSLKWIIYTYNFKISIMWITEKKLLKICQWNKTGIIFSVFFIFFYLHFYKYIYFVKGHLTESKLLGRIFCIRNSLFVLKKLLRIEVSLIIFKILRIY